MTGNKKGSAFPAIIVLLAVLAFPFVAVAAPDAEQAPAGIVELLNKLGQKVSSFTTLKTDFLQEKELSLFQDKLVLTGRIYLEKPDKIAWHVDHPLRYSVLITDKLIRQWDGETNKVQELSLAKNPVFQTVLGQLRMWFAGDYASLLKDHEVRIIGNKPLTLECSPNAKSVTFKILKSITLTFREDQTYLQRIRILEKTGDTTTIIFKNTVLNAPLDKGSFDVAPLKPQSQVTGQYLSSVNAMDVQDNNNLSVTR